MLTLPVNVSSTKHKIKDQSASNITIHNMKRRPISKNSTKTPDQVFRIRRTHTLELLCIHSTNDTQRYDVLVGMHNEVRFNAFELP